MRFVVLLFVVCIRAPLHAQTLPRAEEPTSHTDLFPLRSDLASTSANAKLQTDDVAFLASLAVPGAGQYLQHQQRWLPYAALETWAWVRYLDHRSTARKLAARYRDFAWSVARRISTGARRDTTFPYYEVLIHYAASGAYDVDPSTPGVQPEFDPTTFNGVQWDLAQSIFLPHGGTGQQSADGYAAAVAYYKTRAIPDSYAFAWDAGRLEQATYTNVIGESDGAYRDATRLLGLILANHLTSAVDALITARLRNTAPGLKLDTGLEQDFAAPAGAGMRFHAQLRYIF